MDWSFRLFDVAGTAVRVHLTFFLLLAWIARGRIGRAAVQPAAIDGMSSSSCCCSCACCCTSSATSSPRAATASARRT